MIRKKTNKIEQYVPKIWMRYILRIVSGLVFIVFTLTSFSMMLASLHSPDPFWALLPLHCVPLAFAGAALWALWDPSSEVIRAGCAILWIMFFLWMIDLSVMSAEKSFLGHLTEWLPLLAGIIAICGHRLSFYVMLRLTCERVPFISQAQATTT